MRTTIEISDEQRARLLDLAARRGLKGFSVLVQEALDLYLDERGTQDAKIRDALGTIGALDDEAADALEASVRRARASWR